MAAQVLIELIPDVSKVQSSLEQLSQTGAVNDGSAAAYKAGNAELQKRAQLLQQQSSQNSGIESSEKRQLVTLKDLQKSMGSMSAGVLAQVQKIMDANSASTQKYSIAAKDAAKTVSGVLVGATAQYNQTLVANAKAANIAGDAHETLKAKLRTLKEQIAQLTLAGDIQSETYHRLTQEAGDIKDAISDANSVITRAGSDTRGMDNVIQVAQGVTAGFTVATGAAALFGDESDNTQKTLLKVNAAMSVLQGLQQIDNILTSDTFKSLVRLNATRLVTNAALAIENGLNSSSIIVRTGATAAQWLLNAAMAANPIGLMAVALAGVIVAMKLFTDHASKVATVQAEVNSAIQSATVGLDAETASYERFNKQQQAILDAAGAKASEKMEQDLRTLRFQGNAVVTELNRINKLIDANSRNPDVDVTKLIEQKVNLENKLADINAEGKAKQIGQGKAALEESSNDAIQAADNLVKIAKKGSAGELAAQRSAAGVRRTELLKQLDYEAKVKGVSVEGDKDFAQRRATIEADYTDQVQGIQQQAEDKSKAGRVRRLAAERAAIDNLLILVREGSEAELKLRENAIDKQAQQDRASIERRNANAATVALEEANIAKKAEDEKARLRIEFANKRIKDEAGIELIAAQSRVAAFREGTAEYYAAQKTFLAQQADNQSLDVQQSTESEETKSAKIKLIYIQLNKDLDGLRRQQQEQELTQQSAQIDALNNLALTRLQVKAANPRLQDNFRAEQDVRTEELRQIEQERGRLHQKALNDQLYAEQQYQTDLTNNTAKGEAKRGEIVNANAQREKDIRHGVEAAAIAAAQETAAAIFDVDKAQRDAELQAQLDQLDRQKTEALATKNITERQKADIQKKYDRETARLKNEAARKERKAQTNQAIVNGLLAVTNALATVQPFWAAIIAAAGAAVTTGIQIAKINSTPLPAYEKGTLAARPGYALVGEKGPEIVRFAGGEKVWTHTQSDKLMKEWNAANHSATIAEHRASQRSSSTEIDYDQLGKSVAKHMPKSPQVHMVADKNGLTIFLQSETSKQIIRNQRYTFGG